MNTTQVNRYVKVEVGINADIYYYGAYASINELEIKKLKKAITKNKLDVVIRNNSLMGNNFFIKISEQDLNKTIQILDRLCCFQKKLDPDYTPEYNLIFGYIAIANYLIVAGI